MASITSNTPAGTKVTIDGDYTSPSSFEILKGAMALIDLVEQEEEKPEFHQALTEGFFTARIGGTTGLILTNSPDNIVFEPTITQEGTGVPGVLTEFVTGEAGANEYTEEDEIAELEEAHAVVKDILDEFTDQLPNLTTKGLVNELAEVVEALDEFADEGLDEDHPALDVIIGLGSGLRLAAGFIALNQGITLPESLYSEAA